MNPPISDGAPQGEAADGAGDGGLICVPSGPPSSVCGLCGNGVRDTCNVGTAWDSTAENASAIVLQEDCDGADFGGATCASLGFAGGTLQCDSSCTFDTTGCQTCSPTDTSVGAACSRTAPQGWAVDVAASASEIGFAWVQRDAQCHGVRFNRYSADLVLTGESGCLGSCDALAVAAAATPSGWLLAIGTTYDIDLLAIDPQGNPVGTERTIANAGGPVLSPRGSAGTVTGGPLLMWIDRTGALSAALLRADGSEERPAFGLASRELRGADAVFTGSGYLLAWGATSAPDGSLMDTIVVRGLGLDGSLGPEQQLFPTLSLENPKLAWSGSEVRVSFDRFDISSLSSELDWARLDPSGVIIGAPFRIASPVSDSPGEQGGPIAMLGSDMVALVGPATALADAGRGELVSVHIASNGTIGAPVPMATVGSALQLKLVTQGTKAFAAWLTQSSSLERYTSLGVCTVPSSDPDVLGETCASTSGGRVALARVQ